jgi:hypothetical protein
MVHSFCGTVWMGKGWLAAGARGRVGKYCSGRELNGTHGISRLHPMIWGVRLESFLHLSRFPDGEAIPRKRDLCWVPFTHLTPCHTWAHSLFTAQCQVGAIQVRKVRLRKEEGPIAIKPVVGRAVWGEGRGNQANWAGGGSQTYRGGRR